MRKAVVLLVLLALCGGAALAAGCGDGTAQARTHMEQADRLSSGMRLLADDAAFDVAGLLAELGVEVKESGTVNKQAVTDAANEQLDRIIANGEKARKEYAKILELEGADPYKEYARARIKAIEDTIKVLEPVGKLLEEIGSPGNTASIGATVTEWAKANARVAVRAVKAFASWRSAAQVREKNNLGPEQEPAGDTSPGTAP